MTAHNVVANMNVFPHGLHTGELVPGTKSCFTAGSVALSFVPGTEKVISADSYSNLQSLRSVDIPPNTRVDADAFKNCKELRNVNVLDPSSTLISTGAFQGCPLVKIVDKKPARSSSKTYKLMSQQEMVPRQKRSAGGEALSQAFS